MVLIQGWQISTDLVLISLLTDSFGFLQVFERTDNINHAILIEEDMVLSPDFLVLFEKTAPLLDSDPSLMCKCVRDMAHSSVWHDAFLYVRRDWFICVTWLIYSWHDSSMCDIVLSPNCLVLFDMCEWVCDMCECVCDMCECVCDMCECVCDMCECMCDIVLSPDCLVVFEKTVSLFDSDRSLMCECGYDMAYVWVCVWHVWVCVWQVWACVWHAWVCVWHGSCVSVCVTCVSVCVTCVSVCVPWLMCECVCDMCGCVCDMCECVCDMAHVWVCLWHGSFIYVTWLIPICEKRLIYIN